MHVKCKNRIKEKRKEKRTFIQVRIKWSSLTSATQLLLLTLFAHWLYHCALRWKSIRKYKSRDKAFFFFIILSLLFHGNHLSYFLDLALLGTRLQKRSTRSKSLYMDCETSLLNYRVKVGSLLSDTRPC